jgi:hypothetical protein
MAGRKITSGPVFDTDRCAVDPVTRIPCENFLVDPTVPDAPPDIPDCPADTLAPLPAEPPCPTFTTRTAAVTLVPGLAAPTVSLVVEPTACCDFNVDLDIQIPDFGCPVVQSQAAVITAVPRLGKPTLALTIAKDPDACVYNLSVAVQVQDVEEAVGRVLSECSATARRLDDERAGDSSGCPTLHEPVATISAVPGLAEPAVSFVIVKDPDACVFDFTLDIQVPDAEFIVDQALSEFSAGIRDRLGGSTGCVVLTPAGTPRDVAITAAGPGQPGKLTYRFVKSPAGCTYDLSVTAAEVPCAAFTGNGTQSVSFDPVGGGYLTYGFVSAGGCDYNLNIEVALPGRTLVGAELTFDDCDANLTLRHGDGRTTEIVATMPVCLGNVTGHVRPLTSHRYGAQNFYTGQALDYNPVTNAWVVTDAQIWIKAPNDEDLAPLVRYIAKRNIQAAPTAVAVTPVISPGFTLTIQGSPTDGICADCGNIPGTFCLTAGPDTDHWQLLDAGAFCGGRLRFDLTTGGGGGDWLIQIGSGDGSQFSVGDKIHYIAAGSAGWDRVSPLTLDLSLNNSFCGNLPASVTITPNCTTGGGSGPTGPTVPVVCGSVTHDVPESLPISVDAPITLNTIFGPEVIPPFSGTLTYSGSVWEGLSVPGSPGTPCEVLLEPTGCEFVLRFRLPDGTISGQSFPVTSWDPFYIDLGVFPPEQGTIGAAPQSTEVRYVWVTQRDCCAGEAGSFPDDHFGSQDDHDGSHDDHFGSHDRGPDFVDCGPNPPIATRLYGRFSHLPTSEDDSILSGHEIVFDYQSVYPSPYYGHWYGALTVTDSEGNQASFWTYFSVPCLDVPLDQPIANCGFIDGNTNTAIPPYYTALFRAGGFNDPTFGVGSSGFSMAFGDIFCNCVCREFSRGPDGIKIVIDMGGTFLGERITITEV